MTAFTRRDRPGSGPVAQRPARAPVEESPTCR